MLRQHFCVCSRFACASRVSPPSFQESTRRQQRCLLFYFLRFAKAKNDGALLQGFSVLSLLRDIKCAIVISNHFYVFGCLLLCRYFLIQFQLQFLAFFCHIVASNFFFPTLWDLVKHFLVPPLTFAD